MTWSQDILFHTCKYLDTRRTALQAEPFARGFQVVFEFFPWKDLHVLVHVRNGTCNEIYITLTLALYSYMYISVHVVCHT